MNKIITILPTTFKNKREFKELRKDIVNSHRIENIIDLPVHTFQPHVAVCAIILQLSTNRPQDHFWKFKVENDGYTQNKRRKKKEGENDFDIFWKFKNGREEEKLKYGFRRLAIAEIKEQKDYEFTLPPDFSSLFKPPTYAEQLAILEKEKKLDLQILENWKKLKVGMEERVEKIKKRWNIQELAE